MAASSRGRTIGKFTIESKTFGIAKFISHHSKIIVPFVLVDFIPDSTGT